MKYQELLIEIESLHKIYKFSPTQLLTLQLASSFKCNKLDYDQLKEEFCKK